MQEVKSPHHLLIPVWGKCSAPCRIHLPSARIGLLNNYSFFGGDLAIRPEKVTAMFQFSLLIPPPLWIIILFLYDHQIKAAFILLQSHQIWFSTKLYSVRCKESNEIKLPFKAFPSQKPILYAFPFFAKGTVVLYLNSYTFSPSHTWTQNNTCA